jgi:predicted metal-dependent peptidase
MARKQTKRTAAQRIARARSALVVFQPFYGTLLMNLPSVEDRTVGTAAVDGTKLYYNPDFIDRLADDELLFVLSHEAAHCANLHHTRRKDRDPELWNVAADYVINLDLTLAQIGRMPEKGLLDHSYRGMGTEDVYASLVQQQEKNKPQPQQGQDEGDDAEQDSGKGEDGGEEGGEGGDTGQPGKPASGDGNGSKGQPQAGQGSGDGNDGEGAGDGAGESEGEGGDGKGQGGAGGKPGASSDEGGCGGVIDAPGTEAEKAEQEAEWQTVTRQAIAVATRAAGSMPSHLERLVGELNKAPQNWREILRRFVDQSIRTDYSWQRPDRRFGGADFLLPGTVSDGVNHLLVVRDTSGSINDTLVASFDAEIQAMLDEGAVDKVTVIDCDAAIHQLAECGPGDTIPKAKGGGGTSYRPVWQWLKDTQEDIAAVVYFTDLEPNDGFGDEPHLPVLWAAYGDPRYLREAIKRVTFGEVIEVRD